MIKYIGNDRFLLNEDMFLLDEETEPITTTSLDLFGIYRLHYEFISNVEDNIRIERRKLKEMEEGLIMRVATIFIILLLRNLKYEVVFNELYLSQKHAYLHVQYEDGIEIEAKFDAGEEERLILCLKDKGGFELNNIGLRLNELTKLIS